MLDCLHTRGGDVQQAHTHNTRGIAWQWLLVMSGSVLLQVVTATAGGNVNGDVGGGSKVGVGDYGGWR